MSVFENNVFERGNLAVIVTHSISNLGESNSRDNYQIHIITDPEQSGYSLDELHDYFSLEGHRIISYDQLTLSANSPFNLQNMKALCFSDLIAKLIVESTPNGKMLGSLGPSLVDSNDYNANTLVDVDLSTVFNFLENKDVLSKIGFNVDVKPVGLTPVDIGELYSLFPEQDIPTLEEVFNKPIQENEQITNLTNSEGIEKVVFRDSREKTYVIKKTKDRDLLEKELFLESLAKSRNIRLARWMVNSGDKQIFKQGDTYVSLWEHSIDKDHSEVDLDKKLMFSEFSRYKLGLGTNNREQERIEKLGKNLEGNSLMHKMYVLALYHATLTEVRGLDVLNQSTLSDFLDFEQFEESAAKSRPNSGSKQLTDALFSKKDYRRMVEYLEEVEKQTGECYIHDDAKDANFFSNFCNAFSTLGCLDKPLAIFSITSTAPV